MLQKLLRLNYCYCTVVLRFFACAAIVGTVVVASFFAAVVVVAVSCRHRSNCCNGLYCIFNEVALVIDIVPVVVAAAAFAVLYIDGIANVSLLLLLLLLLAREILLFSSFSRRFSFWVLKVCLLCYYC